MDLSPRKQQILKLVIDDYIHYAEPVGSKTLLSRHDIGVSSATIRNEMAELENLGLLEQPHTSAGRAPTHKGYRFYVNSLMHRPVLTASEAERFAAVLNEKITNHDRLVERLSSALSDLTGYTVAVLRPEIKKAYLRHIELLPIDMQNVVIVIVTGEGVVKNKLIRMGVAVQPQFIYRLSRVLQERLIGLSMAEISLSKLDEIRAVMSTNHSVLAPVLGFISEVFEHEDERDVFLEGASNLFHFPEYQDLARMQSFYRFLESKRGILAFLSEDGPRIRVSIGAENGYEELRDCSTVTGIYRLGATSAGRLAVIGPTRMDYSKVVGLVDYMTRRLSTILDREEESNEQETRDLARYY